MRLAFISCLSTILCFLLHATSNAQSAFELAIAQRQGSDVIRLSYPPCTGPQCRPGNHDVEVNVRKITPTLLDGRRLSSASLLRATQGPRVVIVAYGGKQIPLIFRQSLSEHVLVLNLAHIPQPRSPGVPLESEVMVFEFPRHSAPSIPAEKGNFGEEPPSPPEPDDDKPTEVSFPVTGRSGPARSVRPVRRMNY